MGLIQGSGPAHELSRTRSGSSLENMRSGRLTALMSLLSLMTRWAHAADDAGSSATAANLSPHRAEADYDEQLGGGQVAGSARGEATEGRRRGTRPVPPATTGACRPETPSTRAMTSVFAIRPVLGMRAGVRAWGWATSGRPPTCPKGGAASGLGRSQYAPDRRNHTMWPAFRFEVPYPNDVPAVALESLRDESVATSIATDLAPPVRRRIRAHETGMAMPKSAINEDRYLPSGIGDVRLTDDCPSVAAVAAKTSASKFQPNQSLNLGVATTNGGHHPSAIGFIDCRHPVRII